MIGVAPIVEDIVIRIRILVVTSLAAAGVVGAGLLGGGVATADPDVCSVMEGTECVTFDEGCRGPEGVSCDLAEFFGPAHRPGPPGPHPRPGPPHPHPGPPPPPPRPILPPPVFIPPPVIIPPPVFIPPPPPGFDWWSRSIDQARFDHLPFNWYGVEAFPVPAADGNGWGFWAGDQWIAL